MAAVQSRYFYERTQALNLGVPLYELFFDLKDDTDLLTTRWTSNVTNSTAPTTVLDAQYGQATFTNTAGDNDRIEWSGISETFKFTLGSVTVFAIMVKQSEPIQADFGAGLVITDADWIGDTAIASDGMWFRCDDGDALLDLVSAYDATAIADYTQNLGLATVDTSFHEYMFKVEMDPVVAQKGHVTVFVDGVAISSYDMLSINHDEEMALALGLQNGEAVAHTMTVDYMGAFQYDRNGARVYA